MMHSTVFFIALCKWNCTLHEASFVSETKTENRSPKLQKTSTTTTTAVAVQKAQQEKQQENCTFAFLKLCFSKSATTDYPFWFRANWLAVAFYSQLALIVFVCAPESQSQLPSVLFCVYFCFCCTFVLGYYYVIKKPNDGAQFAKHNSAAIASKLGDDTETTERTTQRSREMFTFVKCAYTRECVSARVCECVCVCGGLRVYAMVRECVKGAALNMLFVYFARIRQINLNLPALFARPINECLST